jgi:hypothetical protein
MNERTNIEYSVFYYLFIMSSWIIASCFSLGILLNSGIKLNSIIDFILILILLYYPLMLILHTYWGIKNNLKKRFTLVCIFWLIGILLFATAFFVFFTKIPPF